MSSRPSASKSIFVAFAKCALRCSSRSAMASASIRERHSAVRKMRRVKSSENAVPVGIVALPLQQ